MSRPTSRPATPFPHPWARTGPVARPGGALAVALVGILVWGTPQLAAQEVLAGDRDESWLVATAVLAAPEPYRAEAEVRAWTTDGGLAVLREGSNGLVCLADRPGDDAFSAACYHESLEPFMARGRDLRAQGVEGMERHERRWEEARAGTLPMPSGAAMVYNIGFPDEDVDPATADPTAVPRLHAIYIPGATAESTGLPTSGDGGGPWLMWPGEPSAHVMVLVPPGSGG